MAGRRVAFGSEPEKHTLVLSLTGSHPQRSVGSIHSTCLSALVPDRAMEAWYHVALHECPPIGGSHGKPHRTPKSLSHARRRGGRLAACGNFGVAKRPSLIERSPLT